MKVGLRGTNQYHSYSSYIEKVFRWFVAGTTIVTRECRYGQQTRVAMQVYQLVSRLSYRQHACGIHEAKMTIVRDRGSNLMGVSDHVALEV